MHIFISDVALSIQRPQNIIHIHSSIQSQRYFVTNTLIYTKRQSSCMESYCNILKNKEIRDSAEQSILQSKKKKIECGFVICKSKDKIYPTPISCGGKSHVMLNECPEKKQEVLKFHTHPSGILKPSEIDALISIIHSESTKEASISCIGYNGHVSCYSIDNKLLPDNVKKMDLFTRAEHIKDNIDKYSKKCEVLL